jgi:hypothetical protein
MCYDAYTKSEFILHAYIIAWTGDIPALTKIMNVTGHNSYSGCRFCNIQGVYSNKYKHIYYHPKPKGTYIKKNHSNWLKYINEIETASSSKEKEILIKKYGNYYLIIKLLL